MRRPQLIGLSFLLLAAGCSHGTGNGATGEATAAPASAAVATASAAAAPQGTGTPIAAPTPTADPNLLSTANGTILRSYSPVSLDHIGDGSLGNVAEGFGSELSEDTKPPFVFTFELPGSTKIDSFSAALRAEPSASSPPANVAIAVSTSGADSGFRDVGTITRNPNGPSATLTANVEARWVRVTANQPFDSVTALGTLAPSPAQFNPAGTYIVQAIPDMNGSFVMSGTQADLDQARFVAAGAGLTGTTCTKDVPIAPYVGQLAGRTWTATFAGNKDANPDSIHAVINDDASIIAGVNAGGSPMVFMRTTKPLGGCVTRTNGTGGHRVLVLDQDPIPTFYPAEASPPLAGYAFDAIGAGMIDAPTLARYDAVITRGVCKLADLAGPQQLALLLQWVTKPGHKLIVAGSGCQTGADFTWLPYPFTTNGPGPESENASLIQVEDDALGTNDKSDDAHFVDAVAYVKSQNDLSATGPVTTTDGHWCGHFFVAKTTNLNGFVQIYANDGGGFVLYDGFNPGDDGNPILQKIRRLELGLPVPSELPCTQRATSAFLLEPSQEVSYSAGTAQTITRHIDLLANQGWNGHVSVKAAGPLRTSVNPATFDVAGGVVHLDVITQIPASTKPGVSTILITADNGSGKTAQATLTLTGIATIKKVAIAPHQSIRLYGIHFDYDSAHIQPRSEPVIADVAALMRANPAWRFEISGHTDSDGGAAYNLALSQRRAQAVVNDLATRYGIARSRMVAKGYGLSRPVASNSTDAGKALNRRVELERLQ